MELRALRVAAAYIVAAGAWIAVSSSLPSWFAPNASPASLANYEILKGWGFVAVTGIALYILLLRFLQRTQLAEVAEKSATETYLGVLELTPVAVFVQQQEHLVSVNANAVTLLGAKSAADLIGRNALDFVSPESRQRILALAESYALKGVASPVVEERFFRIDGMPVDVQMTLTPTLFRGRRAVQTIIHDVSELARQREALARRLTTDAVTGLPNITMLRDRLAQAVPHAKRFNQMIVVLTFDIVHFRHVIDEYGYQGGDEVLKSLATRLVKLVRAGDTVARVSGDEFVIMLVDVRSREDAREVVRKILNLATQPIPYRGETISFAVTTGVAIFPEAGEDADALIQRASVAMLRAKELERGSIEYYSQSVGQAARERARVASALREAMGREEFALHYQPQVSAETGTIIGCEALMRWNSPLLGPVSPVVFIPIAEDSGLIEKLGLWALETACKQAKAWRDAGFEKIVVSVNISGNQLRQSSFVESVRRGLAKCDIESSWIELELTESILMRDVQGAVATARQLKELGLRLAIDDFGTGYSNLAELSRLPADRLKIDQSFVRGMERPEAAAIARTIISLGHALGLEVIAEGVETEAQARTLKEWGCEEFQGYLFGHPMNADQFTARLRESNLPATQ